MKRFFLVLLVFIFIPCFNIYGQALVFDAVLDTLLTKTGLEQATYFTQQLKDNIEQLDRLKNMVENAGNQAKMAAQNLESIKDIGSWDDFMDFYNRQLYLERQTAQAWDNMNVTIGKKQYHISDLGNIGAGMKDEYVDYWNKEFTEEQRREMWMGLGLTPANYAFVQPFRAKANEIVTRQLTSVGIQNEWYMRQMARNKEIRDKLAEDQHKEPEHKIGHKEVMMMVLESLLDTNKVLNDMAMNQAQEAEERAVDKALANPPKDPPTLGVWGVNGFEEIP